MMKRPDLSIEMNSNTFQCYYYLKEELVAFCRENGLPTAGGKLELTERIACFLDTGQIPTDKISSGKHTKNSHPVNITEESRIEENFVCSEKHRAFFREQIGSSFSFNVQFQKWLKGNAGKTYGEAIQAYKQIQKEKKNSRTKIEKQFEYNTYIRDFFEDNKGKKLDDAIKCWKYKKQLKGHNRYEKEDLAALDEPDSKI